MIIAGVHKAGTTSLFTYLASHRDICGSSKKEIHYFTPVRYGKELPPLDDYSKYFSHWSSEKYLLEASPSYFYGGEKIINLMNRYLDHPKILILLRNPVDRFLSFYRHLKSKLLIDEDINIEAFLNEAVKKYNDESPDIIEDNYYHRGIKEGKYIDYLIPWYENFKNDLKIIFFEDLRNFPIKTMVKICNWLDIDSKIYTEYDYLAENRTVFSRFKIIHRFALKINNKAEPFFRRNPKIKKTLRKAYYQFAETKDDEMIQPEQKDTIVEFYAESNKRLYHFLESIGYDCKPDWLNFKKSP